jgi:ribosomal protein S18 acetylase RimI-like enzyme
MVDITIRAGVPSDGHIIVAMAKELSIHEGAPMPLFDKEKFERFGFGKQKMFNVLIAELKNRSVCGYVLFCNSFHVGLGTPGFNMLDLYVEKKFRRKGIAKSLMQTMAGLCLEIDGKWITWQCQPNNKDALEYYKSIGGRQYKSVDFEISDYDLRRLASKVKI